MNVILRADVQGSLDAVQKSLEEIPRDEVKLQLLHAAVGGITEGDVVLAAASDAIVFGFHVVPDPVTERMARETGVDIRLYRVIYDLLDDIRLALEGLLEPERNEETRGRAEVREVFRITRVGVVAGCYVTEGTIARPHHLRVIRDGRIVLPTADSRRTCAKCATAWNAAFASPGTMTSRRGTSSRRTRWWRSPERWPRQHSRTREGARAGPHPIRSQTHRAVQAGNTPATR